MQRLHVVGFTSDLDGLIFSVRRGTKSGGYYVALDEKLLESIEEARRLQDERNGYVLAEDGTATRRRPRPDSTLTPREIQARLRAGTTVQEVADEAGVEEEWVMRWAAPVLAEQAQVVMRTREMTFGKARLGASSQPLGTAVLWNLLDRGLRLSDEAFDASWTAFNLHGTSWVVRFTYTSRQRTQSAEWEVDLRERELMARNRLASELGYVEPGRRRRRIASADVAGSGEPGTGSRGGRHTAGRGGSARGAKSKSSGGTKKAGAKRPEPTPVAPATMFRLPMMAPERERPTHLARPPSPIVPVQRPPVVQGRLAGAPSLQPAPVRAPRLFEPRPAPPPAAVEDEEPEPEMEAANGDAADAAARDATRTGPYDQRDEEREPPAPRDNGDDRPAVVILPTPAPAARRPIDPRPRRPQPPPEPEAEAEPQPEPEREAEVVDEPEPEPELEPVETDFPTDDTVDRAAWRRARRAARAEAAAAVAAGDDSVWAGPGSGEPAPAVRIRADLAAAATQRQEEAEARRGPPRDQPPRPRRERPLRPR